MLVKGLAVAAVLASAPIALVTTQEPGPVAPQPGAPATKLQELQRRSQDPVRMQQELDAARAELERLRQQLDHALEALDRTVEPQRERNCSPSRSRALMSHYRWLRDEGHEDRAANALARVVEQVGDDQNQRNHVANNLMTDKETAGAYDDVALAIAQKMVEAGSNDAHQLDTIALAYFLNGRIAQAVEAQRQAVAAGGGEDYRRRLRTYEAAHDQLTKGRGEPPATGEQLLAGSATPQ